MEAPTIEFLMKGLHSSAKHELGHALGPNEVKMLMAEIERLRAAAARADVGAGPWCQPGDIPKRQWLLTFEDADRGTAVFDDEAEARAAFRRANEGGWNCFLFQAAPAVGAVVRADENGAEKSA